MDPQTYVLYHGNCPDGMAAAWAFWFSSNRDPKVLYLPVLYGEPMPDIPDQKDVHILDFSYPRRDLLELYSRSSSLRVIDHHKTAQAELKGLPFATFDLERSGAGLTWDTVRSLPRRVYGEGAAPVGSRPKIIDYAEDRDLWRFRLPESRAIYAFMRTFPYELEAYNTAASMLEKDFADCVNAGKACLRLQEQLVNDMTAPERIQWCSLAGYEVPVVNTTCLYSEVGEALCLKFPDAPFAAYYLDRGNVRQWGLRSRGGFDCSVVASRYGGGGHPGAAGFTQLLGASLGEISRRLPSDDE